MLMLSLCLIDVLVNESFEAPNGLLLYGCYSITRKIYGCHLDYDMFDVNVNLSDFLLVSLLMVVPLLLSYTN